MQAVDNVILESAFALPMLIATGIMFLMMALFRKKPENPSVVDMNTPSIQMTRGGTIPVVHGVRRVGATFCWVGNRYTVEEVVESVGKSVAKGTAVETQYGSVPVEKIKKGDRIWVRKRNGKNVLRKVASMSQRTVSGVIRVTWANDTKTENVEITPDHLMWAKVQGLDKPQWVQARDIHPGDVLYSMGDIEREVTGVISLDKEVEVFCPTMSRFSPKNFYASGVCVHNIDDVTITQTAYFESSWHALACGPVTTIEGIWENGKQIAGPFYSGSTPSGTTVSIGENSSFKVYWGLNDTVSNDGNQSSQNPASADPILSQFCALDESGTTSNWPNVCFVVWQTRRLGVYPRWPQVEYEIISEASGAAQSYGCGFDIDDSNYADAEGLDGVNPALSLFLFMTAPYPCGLSIPGEMMDFSLFEETANYIRQNELWNSNVLAQQGHEYHRMVGEAMSDMGAVLVERDGLIGPKLIRNGLESDLPIPLVTGDTLRPPDDEISRSHIANMNETIQFKFHQRTLNYRQQTIDVDNQSAVADGEYRRKKTTAELATITGWQSASVVSNRRTYESTVSGSSIVLNGDRELRELPAGTLIDVANVGKYRITATTPDFDSTGVKLELTLDPYNVGEITDWIPEDETVIPEPPVVEGNIAEDIYIADTNGGEPGEYGTTTFAAPLVIRGNQSMNNIGWYWTDTQKAPNTPIFLKNVSACPGGHVIDIPTAGSWSNNTSNDLELKSPCVIAFYPNGDHFSVPTAPLDDGTDHMMFIKVWYDDDKENVASSCCQTLSDKTVVEMELAGVSHFEDLSEKNYEAADTAQIKYDLLVSEGILPAGMRLMVPIHVKRGVSANFAAGQNEAYSSYKQGSIIPASFVQQDGVPPFRGSLCYVTNRSKVIQNFTTPLYVAQAFGYEDSSNHFQQIELQMFDAGLYGYTYETKFVPCTSDGTCVPIADTTYVSSIHCGGKAFFTGEGGCGVDCYDPDNYNSGSSSGRYDISAGGGHFCPNNVSGNLLSGGGNRNFTRTPFTNKSHIFAVRSGGLPGSYGSRVGVTIPSDGGLIETTASSSTVDIPDQGYMGMLDGYYRVHQGDHTSISSSLPSPQMIAISWSYKIPNRNSRNLMASNANSIEELSEGYFKVTLQGAGIYNSTDDTYRLPGIWETPDYNTSKWTTWVDFEEWILGRNTHDQRTSMTSIVTFALPRAKEKSLIAKYLNTSEAKAVSAMIGLGGRNRFADVSAVTEPRCRFVLTYIHNGIEVAAGPVYVRAIGTDGENIRTPQSWWDG